MTLAACGDATVESELASSLDESAGRENHAPVITRVALDPVHPTPGAAVRVQVDVDDPDGDPVKMSYEWKLRGQPVGNGTAKLMLNDAARGDDLAVVVVASDGLADSDAERVSVRLANQPPTVQSLSFGPGREVTAGEIIVASAEARDPEGDPLEIVYTWRLNGDVVDEDAGPQFDTRELGRGDVVVVEARASDGDGESEPMASPEIRVTNRPPRVVSRPGGSPPGRGFQYTVAAVDPDGDTPLRFELASAPKGMEIGAHSGEIRWLPGEGQAGRHEVQVVVDDLKGGRVSHAFEIEVGDAVAPAAAER